MAYSAITTPDTYMGAYSAVPIKVYSTDWNTQENFKYIINLSWDKVLISSDSTISLDGNIYTKITSSTPHSFSLGDTVLVDDGINNDQFTGYYIVQAVISSTEFAIDLIPSAPFASAGSSVSKVVKWNLIPDPDGYGKLDLSNVLKDKVFGTLSGQSVGYGLSYDGDSTRFCYDIYCGSEKKYTFNFDDNIFSGGTVGFYASGITSLSGVPFQVGDVIVIQQNQVAWNYTDNYFDGSLVGFTGNTQHSFLVGQTVTVTGQQTFPYYNGETSIYSKTSNALVVFKNWQGSTPVEPGIIYGVPRPEYNTTATITEIFVDPTYGVVIITDLAFTTSSVPISGFIQYADGTITSTPIEIAVTGNCVFDAHVDRPDYSLTYYDQYVIQNRSFTGNNFSTIFNSSEYYRVETSTRGFILGHSYLDTYADGVRYQFYNSNGTSLGIIRLAKSVATQKDFYFPFGLEQIGLSSYVDVTNTFSSYSGSVDSYMMYAYDGPGLAQRTNPIYFAINDDCSMYEIYHLMWKDKYGSYISYPFIYMSRKNVEADRKSYYKQEGNWGNNTFGYNDYDRGETNFYTQSKNSFILNSGWLKDFEAELMEDMMQSTDVYIQTPDNRLFPCMLNETDLEIFKNINEQLFSYTFNVRIGYNEFRF
jgi:hypothetical protein